MSEEKAFQPSKPATTNGILPTATNGGGATIPPSNKSHLYNPTARPPYRPQPYNRRSRHRSGPGISCCCCCFWTTLIFLLILLLAAIAGAALYILYRPHRPEFTIPSLRIHRLNLTTAADTASSHVSTLFNLTITSKNPNSHLIFLYDPFTVSIFSNDVFLGNGTVTAFTSSKKNETVFRNVVVSGSMDLDVDSSKALRPDMKKRNGDLGLVVRMDTSVKVKMDGLKTKKVGIRVNCDGIKGSVPKSKTSPSTAVITGSKCKVDLRVKILKWTF